MTISEIIQMDLAQIDILYIDDDAQARGLVGRLISQKFSNANITFAEDGFEGLIKFGAHHPDIIIVDLYLPYADGYEICRYLLKTFGAINILVLSGRSENSIINSCIEIGVKRYLTKPISLEDLLKAIEEIMADIFMKKLFSQLSKRNNDISGSLSSLR